LTRAMRRLSYYIILTTDGMYADADGGLGHYEPADDEHTYANELVRDAGDVVMGRVMYDVMGYWDTVDVDAPDVPAVERDFATLWRQTPKHIVSRGNPDMGPNATLVQGDVVDAVRRLKAQPGRYIGLGCGADLLATLTRAGLIDDYRLLVTPTALGAGKSLFAALDAPLRLDLKGTRTFSSGSVLLEYVPADRPES